MAPIVGGSVHGTRKKNKGGGSVALSWIMLGLVGWALGMVFVLVLMRMAGDQDRAARHTEKRLDPYSDVTITRLGSG